MGYLGNNNLPFDPTRSSGKPLDAQRFNGDGSTTAFTLTVPVNDSTDLDVYVENVRQEPTTAYTSIGTALTFTEAPPTGTSNIYVVYRNYGTAQVQIADGAISYAKLANNIRQFTQDNFTANGTGQTFTLSETPASANTLMVAIDGVIQTAPVNYDVSGTTLIFTGVPPASSNVTVKHLGFRTTTTVTALTAGSVTSTELAAGSVTNSKLAGSITGDKISTGQITGNLIATSQITGNLVANGSINVGHLDVATSNGTGAMILPTGTTGQRPGNAANGSVRFNTSNSAMEFWTGMAWYQIQTSYSVNYLVVGGGAGGGCQAGGGGGAGGYLSGTTLLNSGQSYTVTVGSGGAGSSSTSSRGANGTSSLIGSLATGVGGGGGGSRGPGPSYNGYPGGSGGGGAGDSGAGGSGTPGQGNPGGSTSSNTGASGGGGAGAAGSNQPGSTSGASGGAGTASSISGSSVTYAGGGGGGGQSGSSGGSGGPGGGGSGSASGNGSNGTTNLGGGGGGAYNVGGTGGTGGSGIVIISYPGAQKGTGGTVTSSGGYTIHTFNSSDTYTA